MTAPIRFTAADLELFPERLDGTRYETIDGELHVSRAPDWEHQYVGGELLAELREWNLQSGLGVALTTPGLVLVGDDNVIPDLVWVSKERLRRTVDEKGHFTAAPELVVEVLSPGAENEERDLDLKLKLYSRQGVHEYWIADRRRRRLLVYRRRDAALHLAVTLESSDTLTSPLLPGFACPLANIWSPFAESGAD